MEQYNQQIQPDATQATVPEEIHPVAAAFGGDIGQALQHGGEEVASRIENLSMHLARMNYYRQEAQKADVLTNYKTAFQNKLYGDPNDPHATVTAVNGSVIPKDVTFEPGQSLSNTEPQQTMEIPAAVYSRQGYAASGALEDVDNWHQINANKFIQDAQAQGLGGRALTQLKMGMDNAWASERNMIAKHESTEVDKAQQQSFLKGMQLDADQAVTKQDPISLARTIDSIQNNNNALNDSQGKDPQDPIRQITEDKFVGMAVNNATNTLLKTSGDPTQAQTMIDKLHDAGKINDTVYQDASDHIDKVFKIQTEQADRGQKILQNNGRMNLISQAAQGKIDVTNQSSIDEIAQKDPKLGEAINDNILNKGSNVKDNDATFADLTNKIFTSGSKEQIANFTMQALKANTNGEMSQDRLNILVSAAMDRGKNVADLEKDPLKNHPIQNMIDAGMKILLGDPNKKPDAQTAVDYMTAIKNKQPIPDAVQYAQGQEAMRNNPHLLNIPPNGMIFHDKNGIRRMVYPDLHTESIGGKASTSTDKESNGDSAI